jgi:hypothetical protein
MFITVFTRALHWSISWARSIQYVPSHHISLRSILILPSHLHLGLPSGLFLLDFPPISYMHYSSRSWVSRPSHPLWLDHSNYALLRVQVTKLLIIQFSPTSCHFVKLWSKRSPQHPVLKHPQSMFLNVRDQVSHPCRTIGKIINLYTHVLTFLDRRREDKKLWTVW